MKKLLPLFMLISLISCREETEGWNQLSKAEQRYIRDRAKIQCNADAEKPYKNFLTKSIDIFTNDAHKRGNGYYFEYKIESVTKKSDIRIWKQNRNSQELYFYVTDIDVSNDRQDSYFLRVTRAEQEAMIAQFKEDHCVKLYTSTSIGTDGPLYLSINSVVPGETGTTNKVDTTDSYVLPFNQLAWFATFNFSRKVLTTDVDGKILSTKTHTTSLTGKSYTFSSTNYADTNYYIQKFCELTFSIDGKWQLHKDAVGFSEKTCSTSVPADWDLN